MCYSALTKEQLEELFCIFTE
uniref:Uncharacterized protein n=1 Tax=Arundo donax TaxID=35708 RepID=A0A0A9BPA8_ARUDO